MMFWIRCSGWLIGIALAACHGEPRPAAPPGAPAAAMGSSAAGSAAAAASPMPAGAAAPAAGRAGDDALIGLWKAKRRFGPDARGPLLLQRGSAGWTADFVGRRLAVRAERGELAFELPGGEGGFRGRFAPDGRIAGHWIPPPSVIHGSRFAVPVVLDADGPARWRGEVAPLDDTFTLYLMVQRRPDGALTGFLRNPERNLGARYEVERIERDGAAVRLIGRRRGGGSETLMTGDYDAGAGVLTLPERGGRYELRRDGDASEFYPRGKRPERYVYQPPPALADGWRTGTLDEVGISRAGIEAFIQELVEQPIDSAHAPQVEGVLIARRGKLVLEEYFHGERRDHPHDTRSAAKSLTAVLVGAVIGEGRSRRAGTPTRSAARDPSSPAGSPSGAPLALTTPVYDLMTDGAPPADLDPRKRAMTVEHLLTMRAGFFCDDANPDAPGNEGTIEEQTADPDWVRYSLQVPLATAPDTASVYCSMSPNLALAAAARAAGESALDAFDRLVGRPLQFARYGWPLDPAGNAYGGGGVRALPRDFMKLGQVMLDGGIWNGRRVLDRAFVERAAAPRHDLNGIQYGYLWWSIEYPYKDRTVRAHFAAGNGGQSVMVIPALDLVVAIYAGNYSDRTSIHIQQDLVPTYVLPAVRESGDDPRAPVAPRPFTSPYGSPRPR
jgi:CubicO group peptidase (beta-lactamase class C family)